MDDLISRAAAIKEIEDLMQYYRQIGAECDRDGALFARERIKKLPAVDAVPVVHGRWIDHKDEHQCSECKEITIVDFYVWRNVQFDYCPYCGAKMDGDADA